jgi:hypothetical protein
MRPIVPLPIQFATPDATIGDRARSPMCPAPQAIEGLSGVWSGTLFLGGNEEGTPFSLRQGDEQCEGPVVGRLAFTGTKVPPADVQLLEASATTYVALVGPYYDPASNAQMLTLLEARKAGDRLYGTYRVRPVAGGRTREGRFVATKSAALAA